MHQVLVIDDDADVRDAIRHLLELAGYGVRTSADAAEAVNQLSREPVHVVITDLIMPKVNGVEAIRTILKDFPDVRIIAMSGGGNFGIESYRPNAITTTAFLAAAERAGAHYILSKPFEMAELVRAVEQVLVRGQALH
jgi:CheY-like chemotaxis protein